MILKKRVDKDGKVTFDVVFGPAYKGISLGALVCAALYNNFGVETGFAYNRKEVKDHGEGGSLVGAPLKGRVLIIDDVMSAGTAARESIALIKAAGATPHAVAIALDRQEMATEKLADGSVKDVTSTATWSTSNVDVLTVSTTGMVTAAGPGQAEVIANFGGGASGPCICAHTSVSVAARMMSASADRVAKSFGFIWSCAFSCSMP